MFSKFEDYVEDLIELNDSDRVDYLMELGEDCEQITDGREVVSCLSKTVFQTSSVDGVYSFKGTSKSAVVAGYIHVLASLFDGGRIESLKSYLDKNNVADKLLLEDTVGHRRGTGVRDLISIIHDELK